MCQLILTLNIFVVHKYKWCFKKMKLISYWFVACKYLFTLNQFVRKQVFLLQFLKLYRCLCIYILVIIPNL